MIFFLNFLKQQKRLWVDPGQRRLHLEELSRSRKWGLMGSCAMCLPAFPWDPFTWLMAARMHVDGSIKKILEELLTLC